MLNQIKLFFEQHLALSAPADTSEEKLQIATMRPDSIFMINTKNPNKEPH